MKGSNPTEFLEAVERTVRFQDALCRGDENRELRRIEKAKRTRRRRIDATRPQSVSGEHEELREAWYHRSLSQQCEVCCERPANDAHHVVKEQTLRRHAYDYGYDFEVVRWDVRNRLWTCRPCHEAHTGAAQRIHTSKLRPDTFEFVAEYGFEWAIRREYDHSEEA
jgi:hypothetical protein